VCCLCIVPALLREPCTVRIVVCDVVHCLDKLLHKDSAPVAFFRAPGTISTIDTSGAHIAVGCESPSCIEEEPERTEQKGEKSSQRGVTDIKFYKNYTLRFNSLSLKKC
jgi:hypothetical protein